MGNGAVTNTAIIKARMKERTLTIEWLASRLGKSVTLTRNVVNGYIPKRDGDELLKAIASLLDLKVKDVKLTAAKSA